MKKSKSKSRKTAVPGIDTSAAEFLAESQTTGLETRMFSTANILVLNQDTKLSDLVRELKRRGIKLMDETNFIHDEQKLLFSDKGTKPTNQNTSYVILDVWDRVSLEREKCNGIVPAGTIIPFEYL